MSDAPRRPLWLRIALLLGGVALIGVFVALGNWQLRRLSWKTELITAVEARAFGTPKGLPDRFDDKDHAYLRVAVPARTLRGHLRVKAVTELGPGFWIMRPVETHAGLLWVNQGFVPNGWDAALPPLPPSVSGLLRPTMPEGTLLERNDPETGRWVSRDTAAMAAHLNLGPALPYFLDADHIGAAGDWPRGGMTKVTFRNTHLSYALTWYTLAALLAGTLLWMIATPRKDA